MVKKGDKKAVQAYNDFIDELYPSQKIFGIETKSSEIFKNLYPDKWSDGLDLWLNDDDYFVMDDIYYKDDPHYDDY
tara:strand:+ start:4000 stop:4227 length:228 start_codon:yes stop_codon:yes gene_type:complete